MKLLLFITGHGQLKEYDYFNEFLQKLKLNHLCDIHIYCNNPSISSDIVKYYHNFEQKNKYLTITSQNSGYRTGGVEAVSQGFDMGLFSSYDYVIHIHPDVFITDDTYLLSVLNTHFTDDIAFFLTRSVPNDPKFASFDFFIFKPKILTTNIFKDELYTFTSSPEHYLYNMINKYNIPYIFIKRFENDTWHPRRIDDHLKLYHEHNLHMVQCLLQNSTDKK